MKCWPAAQATALTAAFCLLSTTASAQSGPIAPLPADLPAAVVGADKALHAGGSAGMVIATYGVTASFTKNVWWRSAVAVGAVGVAGVAKEVFDVVRGGKADPLDLVADGVGIAVGLGFMLALEATFDWLRAPPSASATSPLAD